MITFHKANPYPRQKGGLFGFGPTHVEGTSRGRPKDDESILLQNNEGAIEPMRRLTESDRANGNSNEMTAEARKNLKKVGERLTIEDMRITRYGVAEAFTTIRDPSPGEIAQQKLRDAMGPDGRHNRGNSKDRAGQNMSVLRRYGDGHTAGCYCCGVRVSIHSLSLEKLKPALGYRHGNLAPSCGGCNSALGNKSIQAKMGTSVGAIRQMARKSTLATTLNIPASRAYTSREITTIAKLTSLTRSARRDGNRSLYEGITKMMTKSGSNMIGQGSPSQTSQAWKNAQALVREHGGRVQTNADGTVTVIGITKSYVEVVDKAVKKKRVKDGQRVTASVIMGDYDAEDFPDKPTTVTGKVRVYEATDFNGKHLWYTYHVNGLPIDPNTIVTKQDDSATSPSATMTATKPHGGTAMPEMDGTIDISKVDKKKGIVFGWASVVTKDGSTVVDRQGDYIDDEWELEKAAYNFVASCRVGGDNHVRKGVSELVESMVVTEEKKEALGLPDDFPTGWWVGFKINDEEVLKGMADGNYTGFSVHGTGKRIDRSAETVDKGLTYNQRRQKLDEMVTKKYGTKTGRGDSYCYINDFTDSWVVFAVSSAGTRTQYRAGYNLKDETFSNVTEVVEQTTFVTKGMEALARYHKLKEGTNG